ncbi:MAG: fibronectin type III domain-containing protein [Phycisphaeraceae bacterium]|nr:fibronectin type III domain-containing protein [Phycisphaeraceae bacterium]
MFKRRAFLALMGVCLVAPVRVFGDMIKRVIPVTLGQAHKGTLEIDTMLLDSYGKLPENVRQFYFAARKVFEANPKANFTDPAIVAAAKAHGVRLMGGPLLGDLQQDSVTIWLRPSEAKTLVVRVAEQGQASSQMFGTDVEKPGSEQRLKLFGLSPATAYDYEVMSGGKTLASGSFTTAPKAEEPTTFRLAFGTCFHKIGLHNPNLMPRRGNPLRQRSLPGRSGCSLRTMTSGN